MKFFDIETASQPIADLLDAMPKFEAPKNYKDEEKIMAYIEGEQAAWVEKAALKPETGSVVAVGFMDADESLVVLDGYEGDILEGTWGRIDSHCNSDQFAGWNIFGFDLPFLVRRSWFVGVPVPPWVRSGRYWDKNLIDLMECYALGTREFTSLDTAAKALKVGRKNGDGKEFAALWMGTAEQREQALGYLRNDLALTVRVAEKMGVAAKKGGAS